MKCSQMSHNGVYCVPAAPLVFVRETCSLYLLSLSLGSPFLSPQPGSQLDSLKRQILNRSPTLIPSSVACTSGDPTRQRREDHLVWHAGGVCTVVVVLCLLLALTPTATRVYGRSWCSQGFNYNAAVYGSGMQTFDTPGGAKESPFELLRRP